MAQSAHTLGYTGTQGDQCECVCGGITVPSTVSCKHNNIMMISIQYLYQPIKLDLMPCDMMDLVLKL